MKNADDIALCAKEPIHIPGSIQPHGLLLTFAATTQKILQVSSNASAFVGDTPASLLGRAVDTLFDEPSQLALAAALSLDDIRSINPLRMTLQDKTSTPVDVILHRQGDVVIAECEPTASRESVVFGSFYHSVRQLLQPMQRSTTVDQACEHVVTFVKQVTGFDRVMLYRFDEDWHGNVVAEACSPGTESYLHHRFPAGDIPPQARELYRRNWLRLIVDANYTPVPLVPVLNPTTNQPLDLSHSTLRSVSPVHLEYLRNMGVGASMSISIIRDDHLWGLIACHHPVALFVDFQARSSCEFAGQLFSHTMTNLEARDYETDRNRRHDLLADLALDIKTKSLASALMTDELMLSLADATGAALLHRGRLLTIGKAPTEDQIIDIVGWLRTSMRSTQFHTTTLSRSYPPAAELASVASGLLAVSLSPAYDDFILWFKPEVVSTVTWSGNPHEAMERDAATQRINPRRSFSAWQETLRAQSTPWSIGAIEACKALGEACTGVELQRTNIELKDAIGDLRRLNHDLAESNSELDAFAYIVSHDLKEPLRGIRQCTTFLLEDLQAQLTAETRQHADTIVDLSRRMDSQLGALYFYSRVGRVAFSMEETNLHEVLSGVLEILRVSIKEANVKVTIPRQLPNVFCDRVRVGEVFQNLIVNGFRYNDKAEKRIEIGFIEGAPDHGGSVVFFVKDDGIGIAERHHQTIFSMFRRLHGKSEYGGGSGAGLAIVKRIVERHQGRVWLSSEPGQGTTFYFTLEASDGTISQPTGYSESERTSVGD